VLSFDSAIPEYIIGDETRLSQMLINLVSNAVKFTNQGSVEIKVMEQERIDNKVRLCFNICDTGIGIEPDKLNLIFERFTQAEDYTTRLYGGTGLGLNIVKSLVDLHEGDLRVQSTLGKGSEFILELTYPVANTIYSENTLPSNEVLSEVPLKGYSILLVEDNEHNQILAKTYLERAGALIDIAGNGHVGLDSLSKNTYDLIIMDIQMPVMDGIRATEIIRKELSLNIPIIGCSAHALESEKLRCFSAGMNDYITKPYSQLDLVSAVLRLKIEKSMPNYTSNEHSQSTIPSGELEDVNEIFKNWEYQLGKEIADKLMTALLKRIPNDISKIETYVKSSDYSNLESATHNLAGSLGGLNIMNGMRLTRKLEESCKSNNKVVIESIADDLLRYLNHLLLQLS
jgi:CheY-like chemotaxis protein